MVENIGKEQMFQNELDRRWKTVREVMAKERIDCLVMQNTNQTFGAQGRLYSTLRRRPGAGAGLLSRPAWARADLAHARGRRPAAGCG